MSKPYGYLDQPYVPDMLTMPVKPGSVQHIVVEHDLWCPVMSGTGLCICRPVVRKASRAERRRFAKQGRGL